MAKPTNNQKQGFNQRSKRESAKLSKLVYDELTPRSYDRQERRVINTPPVDYLHQISQESATLTRDVESMKQLLPDLELAAQILVSSILSPKEMTTSELSFMFSSSFEDEELGARMIKVVEEYFKDEWELDEELSNILHQILFEKGSFIRAIIPESSLDEIINPQSRVSLESLKTQFNPSNMTIKPLGVLGDVDKNDSTNTDSEPTFSFENIQNFARRPKKNQYTPIHTYINVVDNPDALKLPKVLERYRQESIHSAYSNISLEKVNEKVDKKNKESKEKEEEEEEEVEKDQDDNDNNQDENNKDDDKKDKKRKSSKQKARELGDKEKFNKITVTGSSDREIERTLRQLRGDNREQVVMVKTRKQSEREPLGHPLVMELDTEAVIPAHAPSSPESHIGYFVLLDQYGYPISTSNVTDHYRDLQQNFQNQESGSSNQVNQILSEMRGNQEFSTHRSKVETVSQATQAFASIVEKDLTERLRKGPGYEGVEIERVDHVYQIMLARTLRKKHTQILFIPEELVSYMAFYYNTQGIGKSLLEKTRILASLRVLLMFSSTMASVKNSVTQTNVKVDLDPNDADPMNTIDIVRDSVIRSRNEQYPLGEADPSAVVGFLQRAGVNITYGGHDALPEMGVDINHDTSSKAEIDNDLEEQLRHAHIMAMGLSPETVDISRGVDFATSLVQSSLLLTKRVAIYQNKFEKQLAEFVRKYIYNSEELISRLVAVIKDHNGHLQPEKQWETINSFLNSIYIHLPKPDAASLESQVQAFDKYKDGLEDAIESWFDDNFIIDDAEGEQAQHAREFKSAIYAYYVRRWLRQNNVFPELEELTEQDENGHPVFDFASAHNEHMSSLMGHLEKYLEKAKFAAAKRHKSNEKLKEKLQKQYGWSPDDVDVSSSGGGGSDNNEGGEGGGDDEGGDEFDFGF